MARIHELPVNNLRNWTLLTYKKIFDANIIHVCKTCFCDYVLQYFTLFPCSDYFLHFTYPI